MAFDADKIVARYIAIRDKIDELKKEHAEQLRPYQEALEKLDGVFMDKFNADGVKSLRTNSGTAYTENVVSVTIADWPTFFEYIQQNQLWDLLGHYASKTNVKAFREERDDLPPGINWKEVATVKVRRAS